MKYTLQVNRGQLNNIKQKLKKLTKIENYTTGQFLLLILLIIFIIPPLTSISSFLEWYDFSATGQIGDTIGGVTAPFVNGLAAILVFLAFKSQVKANEIFKNQETVRIIHDQIKTVQDNPLSPSEIHYVLTHYRKLQQPLDIGMSNMINKIIYYTTELSITYELIHKYSGEKGFLYMKLYYMYTIKDKLFLDKVLGVMESILPSVHINNTSYVIEIISQIQYLNESLSVVKEYKGKTK